MKKAAAILAVALMGLAGGCGGSSGGAGGSSQTSSGSAAANGSASVGSTSSSGSQASGGASQGSGAGKAGAQASRSRSQRESNADLARRYPHGDNSIQTFGRKGDEADRHAVNDVVKRYYGALAAGDGTAACALVSAGLARQFVAGLGRSPTLKGKGCGAILSLLFKARGRQLRASMVGLEVTSVRIEGDKGFALLRSKEMPAGEIPVVREHGEWKVAGLIGSGLA